MEKNNNLKGDTKMQTNHEQMNSDFQALLAAVTNKLDSTKYRRLQIETRPPRIHDGKLQWHLDIPRDMRHPDECDYRIGEKEQHVIWEWESAESDIHTLNENFAKKYNIEYEAACFGRY